MQTDFADIYLYYVYIRCYYIALIIVTDPNFSLSIEISNVREKSKAGFLRLGCVYTSDSNKDNTKH